MNRNKNFQYISSIKRRENFPANMFYNDVSATSGLDKAQLFNDYFYSVFSASTGTPQSVLDMQASDHTLPIDEMQFSELDVLDLLTFLDTSTACGIDSLSSTSFKFCAVTLLQIICHLFHTSISFCTIPLDWHSHCVDPVYKTGDKSSVSNCRPISLLCILPKVF